MVLNENLPDEPVNHNQIDEDSHELPSQFPTFIAKPRKRRPKAMSENSHDGAEQQNQKLKN
jgi:hypothetical protein